MTKLQDGVSVPAGKPWQSDKIARATENRTGFIRWSRAVGCRFGSTGGLASPLSSLTPSETERRTSTTDRIGHVGNKWQYGAFKSQSMRKLIVENTGHQVSPLAACRLLCAALPSTPLGRVFHYFQNSAEHRARILVVVKIYKEVHR